MALPVAGSLCDAPNYLLLADSNNGRVELRHGALFGSTDPEALGRALALALAHDNYGDAANALYGAGWTLHTPAGALSPCVALPAVVRNTDAWVAVGYPAGWRLGRSTRRTGRYPGSGGAAVYTHAPKGIVVASGIGPIGVTAPVTVPAADIVPIAGAYYLTLRLLKLA